MINRLCIIGVGLIGGSIARSAKERGLCHEVLGIDCHTENLNKAKSLGVIDIASQSIDKNLPAADFVVVATPVGSIEQVILALKENYSPKSVYTDVGSTKVSIAKALESTFGDVPSNFILGHPIAGAEKSGVEASLPGLFRGKRIILTPNGDTDHEALTKVEAFWRALGGKISIMDVFHHDTVLAATSHLPHVIAYALTDMLGRKDEQNEILKYAAGGFKDFTRIASSDPEMWLDICLANRSKIIELVDQMTVELTKISAMLKEQDSDALYTVFNRAKSARKRFLDLQTDDHS